MSRADAVGDEEAAHEHGATATPQKRTRRAGGSAVDLEEAEEEKEDEEIVRGHRLFKHVAGEVLDGRGGAMGVAEEKREGECSSDPEGGCDDGSAVSGLRSAKRRLVGAAARVDELGGEEEDEDEVEAM